ncbi:hypothetical protein V494_05781 [Pseudogymnoascus sp. VKM F-4513 (FW-928)]|nr:hypothetical protein V494_05781 [Pseudogymnoascus sp. VKM F-4513 (FW-928)]
MRLIRRAKLLPIPQLPSHGPPLHPQPRHDTEPRRRKAARDKEHTDPRDELKQVVRARDDAKAEALGDTALGGALGAEVGEDDVGVEVGELAEEVHRQSGSEDVRVPALLEGRGSSGVGGEDPVRDVEHGEPVVGEVAEDVGGWHGGGGEAVEEDGFELALDEVRDDEGEGDGLHG